MLKGIQNSKLMERYFHIFKYFTAQNTPLPIQTSSSNIIHIIILYFLIFVKVKNLNV